MTLTLEMAALGYWNACHILRRGIVPDGVQVADMSDARATSRQTLWIVAAKAQSNRLRARVMREWSGLIPAGPQGAA